MNRTKVIFGAAGVALTGFGALWGWAVTGDIFAAKLKVLDEENKAAWTKVEELYNRSEDNRIDAITLRTLMDENPEIKDMIEADRAPAESFRDHPLTAVDDTVADLAEDDDFGVSEMRASLAADAPTYEEEQPYTREGSGWGQEIPGTAQEPEGAGVGTTTVALDGTPVEIIATREEADVMNDELAHEDADIPEGETPAETESRLQALIDTYASRPEDRDGFVALAGKSLRVTAAPPYVVDMDDYAYGEGGESHEKVTFHWYPTHRMLLNEDEDPVLGKEVDDMVGWANLQQFGGVSGDPNIVYVRNDRLDMDFEIVQYPGQKLPVHIKYGMPKEEFEQRRRAGLLQLNPEDL